MKHLKDDVQRLDKQDELQKKLDDIDAKRSHLEYRKAAEQHKLRLAAL